MKQLHNKDIVEALKGKSIQVYSITHFNILAISLRRLGVTVSTMYMQSLANAHTKGTRWAINLTKTPTDRILATLYPIPIKSPPTTVSMIGLSKLLEDKWTDVINQI